MNDRLLPKTRPFLFVALLAGVMMAIFGFVGGNKDVTLVGIVLTLGAITCSVVFAMHDELMDRMNM